MGLDTSFYRVKREKELAYFRNGYTLINAIYNALKNTTNKCRENHLSVLIDKDMCQYIIDYIKKNMWYNNSEIYKEDDFELEEKRALDFLEKELFPIFDKKDISEEIIVNIY